MLTKLAPQPKWQEPAIRHVPASPAWRQSSALKWRRWVLSWRRCWASRWTGLATAERTAAASEQPPNSYIEH